MEENFRKAGFVRSTSYETFMLAVSLLSFINLVILILPVKGEPIKVVSIMNLVLTLIFFIDFITRLTISKNKREYFTKQYGWSDLLASIPFFIFSIFRIFRVVRFTRIMRKHGYNKVFILLAKTLSSTALYVVFFLILLVLEFGSMGVLMAEVGAAGANILTASEAIWWTFVSITTVGYGDYYPVTNIGRLVGMVTITVGVGLFGVVTGYLANAFVGSKSSTND